MHLQDLSDNHNNKNISKRFAKGTKKGKYTQRNAEKSKTYIVKSLG